MRAPTLRRTTGNGWGQPVTLFDGTNMTAWKPLGSETNWQVVNAVLTSTKPGANLATVQTFTDFKLHIEFKYGKDGNSGVYLRGRYEVQVDDSAGMEPDSHHTGGIYGFLSPNEDAAKPAGEWQTYDITLFGRTVSVNAEQPHGDLPAGDSGDHRRRARQQRRGARPDRPAGRSPAGGVPEHRHHARAVIIRTG